MFQIDHCTYLHDESRVLDYLAENMVQAVEKRRRSSEPLAGRALSRLFSKTEGHAFILFFRRHEKATCGRWYGAMALLLKLVLTPALIMIATLVARRWGAVKGGWLAGLPLVSGPVSVFLALEQGPLFASRAARASLLGLVAVAAFCVIYMRTAGRRGPLIASAFGIAAYLTVAWGLSRLDSGLVLSALLVVLLVTSAYLIAGIPAPDAPHARVPQWDLPLRMASATMIVLIITESARTLGAAWSGLLSPFPVFASVMAVFSHKHGGPPAALRLLLGVIVGSFASAAFSTAVAALLPAHGLVLTYAAAGCLALAVNWLSLATLLKGRTQ
jgi:hypothetical protein